MPVCVSLSLSICLSRLGENSRELGDQGREQAADLWEGSDKQKRDLLSGVTMEDGVSVLRVDVCMGVAVHISALPRTLSVAREWKIKD